MLQKLTTFVVGAGASCEYGMPDGRLLATEIACSLDIRFENGVRQISGDLQIAEALRTPSPSASWQEACWRIRNGLPALADSIDNYLDNHRGDTEMQRAGRVAIVKSILAAENASKLYNIVRIDNPFNLGAIETSWLVRVFRILQRGRPKDNVDQFFDNCNMIIFNYDRCVEVFFVRALVQYYEIAVSHAQSIVAGANFFHVYGSVGMLPGFSKNRGAIVEFGSSSVDLVDLAGRIRTYSDQSRDDALVSDIGDAIEEASLLVFLGFSYNSQNLDLLYDCLEKSVQKSGRQIGERKPIIIGTGLGISYYNLKNIAANLKMRFCRAQRTPPELHPLTCGDLIDQYSAAFDR